MITIESKDDISIEYTFQIPEKLKYVCLKLLEKEYIIDFSSKMTHIKRIFFDLESKSIGIKYSNNIVNCYDEIDIITDKINSRKKLILLSDDLINNDTLYIPDYISCIDFRNKDYLKKIEHISFNINILNAQENQFYITDKNRLDILKTIELRTNKEMALFPNIEINIKDYGTINDLYIEENKLYIVFDDFKLIVNEEGLIFKELIEIEQETEEVSHFLDDYTIEELEEYLQYRKLLETYKYEDDKELNDAIDTIGYKVIKKLTR